MYCVLWKTPARISGSQFNNSRITISPTILIRQKILHRLLQTARKMETLNQDLVKAQYVSHIDKLTGLFNRRYFDTFSHQLVQEAFDKNFSFALFILSGNSCYGGSYWM